MELEKEKFNFVIEDLRCEFGNVADLFGCDVSEVKNEFARLFAELGAAENREAELKAEASKTPKTSPPLWEDYNSRIHFPKNQILDDLVYKEVNFAMGLWNKKAILTRRRTVIDRILKNFKKDNFSIEDLTDYHYQKVATFYIRARSLVRKEFLQQNDVLVMEVEDDRTNVDLDDLFDGLPKMFDCNPRNNYTKEDHVRYFLMNLQWFGIDTSKLIPGDVEELADILKLNTSTVETKLFKMKREFEEDIKKEEGVRRSEKVLDALVTEDNEIVRFWKGKVEANTLTRRQFITQLYDKMELESLTQLGLKHRHFAAVANLFNCGILEEPAPSNHAFFDQNFAQDQKNYQEEPVTKRAKIVTEPKIEKVKE